jgi:glycosyltransferase involved in cell wall biosynthesis
MSKFKLEPSLTVGVLGLNEERSIVKCIDEVVYACEGVPGGKYEIIIVDDGSTDRTYELAQQCAAKYPNVRVLRNEVNLGYGGAFKRALAEAKMSYCTSVGAVNAIDKESLRNIFSHVGQEDMILTYIANPEVRPFVRRIVSRIYAWTVSLMFGYRLRFYNGCNLYPTHLLSAKQFTSGHAFLADILIWMLDQGLSYKMLPMVLKPRLHEHSTALRLKNIMRVILTLGRIFKERKR